MGQGRVLFSPEDGREREERGGEGERVQGRSDSTGRIMADEKVGEEGRR